MDPLPTRRGARLARRAAWIAFGAVVVLSPLRARIELVARPTTPVYGDFTDFLLFLSDIAVVATIGLWLCERTLERHCIDRRRIDVGPRFIAGPVAVLVAVAWLGVPFASDVSLAAYNAIRLVVLVVLGLYVANEVGRLARMAIPVAVMIFGQAVVGIGQVLSQESLGLSGLGEHVLSPRLGVAVITLLDGTRVLRAYGLADHPNILGGVLVVGLLLLGGAIATDEQRRGSWRLVVFALGVAALFLTFSRGAWIAGFIGVAVVAGMLALIKDGAALRRLGAACVAGVIVAAPFIAPYRDALRARTETTAQGNPDFRAVDERAAVSDATTTLIVDHPVLGVGIGTLPLAIRSIRPDFPYHYEPASVVLLDVTAEMGLVGGAAYLVVLVAPWLAVLRRRARWTPELAVASGALTATTVVGLFDYYPWTYSSGRIWAWLVLGLWVAAYRNALHPNDGYRNAVVKAPDAV